MKNFKRFVSMLLVLATFTALSVCSVSVNAASGDRADVEITAKDQLIVEKLEAFGAITNEYEDLGMYVTRRQMADMIVTYLRMSVEGVAPEKSPFLDVTVKDSAIDSISALYNSGVITGDENLRFHPDDYVTYDEAIVFVVNALGHKLFAAREGGYPTGYHRIAIKYGMLDGLKMQSGKEFIPLCDIYRLMDQGLEAGAVVVVNVSDTSVDYRVSETDTFLSETYEITEHRGIVTGNEFTHLTNADSNLTDEQIAIDGVVYDTPGYVYATSLGKAVKYYLKTNADGDAEIAFIEENDRVNEIISVDSEDLVIAKSDSDQIVYRNEADREKNIPLATNVDVIYNGKAYVGYGKIENVLPKNGHLEALDNNGDGDFDILFVYAYKDGVVEAIDAYEETVTLKDGTVLLLDTSRRDVSIRLMPEGKRMNLSALKQWDVVTVMESVGTPKLTTIYVSRDTVTGVVEEVSDEFGYKIGGNYYETSLDYLGNVVNVNTNAVFYLNYLGKIVTTDIGGAISNKNYAVVAGLDYNTQSVASDIVLKLFTQDGEFVTLPLRNNVTINGERYTVGGSDYAKILQILSNDTKNNEGTYYINDTYVITYTESDGKLTNIDTGKTGTEGKLRTLASGKNFLLRTNGIMRLTTDANATMYARYIPNESYIFITPKAGELDDDDGYKVQRKLDENYYYRQSGNYTRVIDNYVVYDMNAADINVAEVVLLRGMSASSGGINGNSSSFNVVTKITGAVDAEGNATKKLYFGDSNSLVLAEKISFREGEGAYTYMSPDEVVAKLTLGSIIQYGTDEKGSIEAIGLMTKYDDATGVLTSYFTQNAIGDGTDGYNKTMGTVVKNASDKGILTVKDSNGTEGMLYVGSPSVVVYRSSTGKLTTGDINAITTGDMVVIRIQKYVEAAEIIVYK